MNGDNKAGANLNTIYEEFDLSDRIKALKGKHIKIKKIVKKEDGNYSIRESSLFSEKSVDQVNGELPDSGMKESGNYTSNILPPEMNFTRSASYTNDSNNLFKKSYEPKTLNFGQQDYNSYGSFKKESPLLSSSPLGGMGNYSSLIKDIQTTKPEPFASL
jgi:hypothetical protein